MTVSLHKLLRGPKQRLRTWAYPVQRRMPPTLARFERRAVMVFDPSTKYGGWIDRVKGMISVYELALRTQRQFFVHAGATFPLADLIEPATFDWRAPREALRWNPLDTAFHVSRDRKTAAFSELLEKRQRTLFVETNLDYLSTLEPSSSPEQLQVHWGERYRQLFRLAPALEAEVARLVDARALAVHARFTSLLGDFKDVTDKVLPEAERARLLDACLERLATLAAGQPRVFVFSDSTRFLDAAPRVAANIVTLPGAPTHLDHEARVKDSLRKTLLDFHVMVRCQRIVQLRLGAMYDSNFSRYASYVRNVPFEAST